MILLTPKLIKTIKRNKVPYKNVQIHKRTFAINLPALKSRIESIIKIRRVCNSMKNIAASKLPKLIQSCDNSRNYCDSFDPLWITDEDDASAKKYIFVLLNSNFGLCGNNNMKVTNLMREYIKTHINKYKDRSMQIVMVGKRGTRTYPEAQSKQQCRAIVGALHEADPITITNIDDITTKLVLSEKFDRMVIFYNDFINKNKSELRTIGFKSLNRSMNDLKHISHYESDIMGVSGSVLEGLYKASVTAALYKAVVSNMTSEQNARFNSMTNAVKNINDMLKDMRILYNSSRQSAITTEICEVNAGKMAVEMLMAEEN